MHTAGRGKRYTRPPLYTIELKDNEVQLKAFNLLLQDFRDKNPIPVDSIEEIPGLLAAAHLETIKAVKEISGTPNTVSMRNARNTAPAVRTATPHPPGL